VYSSPAAEDCERMKVLHINGNDLTLEDVAAVVYERRPLMLEPEARLTVDRARAVVEDLVENNRVGYGVTTGVGQLSDVRVPPEDIRKLQVNLMRSHAVGVGDPLSEGVSRAMMLLRANSLSKGCSGVRAVIIDTLCEMLNRGVHPVIPSQGSVGASGDLAPLAHLGLVLIAEGEAFFNGKRLAAAGADGSVRIWDVATGQETLRLTGHIRQVTGLAFTPDGHRLLSSGGIVRIWDATPLPD